MVRNEWVMPILVMLIAFTSVGYVFSQSLFVSAAPDDGLDVASGSLSSFAEQTAVGISRQGTTPPCALPVPAPACKTGQTVCIQGTRCWATQYVCSGTNNWVNPSSCKTNMCANGAPGSVGSKC